MSDFKRWRSQRLREEAEEIEQLRTRVATLEALAKAVKPWIREDGHGIYLNSPILTGDDAEALKALLKAE